MFTYRTIEKLIELVWEHPELYDTTHENYMRGKLKDRLWDQIGKEMDIDGKAAKEEWRKLRERHREALRRQKNREGPTRPWIYQGQMEFLRRFMKHRKPRGHSDLSLDDIAHEPNYAPIQADETSAPTDIRTAVTTDEDVEAHPVFRADEESIPCPRNEMTETVNNDPLRTAFQNCTCGENRNDGVPGERRNTKTLPGIQQRERSRNNALYHFFMSMYNITKSLPMRQQRQVRRKLFEVVSQAEDDAESDNWGASSVGSFGDTALSPRPFVSHSPSDSSNIQLKQENDPA